ncbi:MAG: Kynurenine formamidase, bacterial (EC [uncultured Caballeronia sp.]|nr:MAG: Kynurenine formamidase, bacterial (EC [uncultured Caballeronia sp.]
MAWKHKNRWFRRWLMTITFWFVPVLIVAVNEVREEIAYNNVDLQRSLSISTWELTDAQRAAGCPADVLAANAAKHQEALDEYAHRKATLADYLWHAFVGYWIVPAVFLLVVGMLIGGIRRALRRLPRAPSPATVEVKTTTHS